MTTNKKVPTWQFAVCIFGSLIWLLGLSTAEAIKNVGWEPLYKVNAGYVLGYLTAFSAFVFWECVKGRGKRFLDSHPFFPLVILYFFGRNIYFRPFRTDSTDIWKHQLAL